MFETLSIKYYINYEESIASDIELLKKLYNIDLSDESSKFAESFKLIKNLDEILYAASQVCKHTLSKTYKQFGVSASLHDSFLDFLVLETFLFYEKHRQSKLINYADFIKNSDLEIDKSDRYSKLKLFKALSPFSYFFEIHNKDNHKHILDDISPRTKKEKLFCPSFFSPVFVRLIYYCDKDPFLNFCAFRNEKLIINGKVKSSDSKTKNLEEYSFSAFKRYFCNFLYNSEEDIEHDKFFFRKVERGLNEHRKDELYLETVLNCYALERFYDLYNMTNLVIEISNGNYTIDKQYLSTVLFQMFLIPDTFNKKLYMNYLLRFFSQKNIDTENIFTSLYSNNYSYSSIVKAEENLQYCCKFINYLSFVYLPLLAKCFNIIYYQTHKNQSFTDLANDLKSYIIKKEMLEKYERNIRSSMGSLKTMDAEQQEMLMNTYKNIEKYFLNFSSVRPLTTLSSIDHWYFDSMFATPPSVDTIVKEKTNNDNSNISQNYYYNLVEQLMLDDY